MGDTSDDTVHDVVVLGVMSQCFFIVGYLVSSITSLLEGNDVDWGRDIPLIASSVIYAAVYVCGYTLDDVFSFQGWGYIFVCTMIGTAHAALVCSRNDLSRARCNMIVMLLAFSNLIALTTRLGVHHGSGACIGTMMFSYAVSWIPFGIAVTILKNNISSFDSRIRLNRWRLISFIALWQMRIFIMWNDEVCGGGLDAGVVSFWHIIIDIACNGVACDLFWI